MENKTLAKEAALQTLGPNLATALSKLQGTPWTWTLKHDHYGVLTGPDHQVLGMSVAYGLAKDGQVHISGNYPDRDALQRQVWTVPYKTTNPSINVSLAKSPAQVAADIERRLLGAYRVLLAQCVAAVADHQAYTDRTQVTANRVATLIGATKEPPGYSKTSIHPYRSTQLPEQGGDIEVSGDNVTFERFHVTADEAEVLLRALVAHRAAKK